jgi:hypothetical protein
MSSRHNAIHWKTNNNPEVTVVNGSIRDWPSALGDQPTEETISTWVTEYEAAMAKESLARDAQTAIEKTDITILRCYENAVTVPATWKELRTALRAIISGTSTATELPTMPDYPEGT